MKYAADIAMRRPSIADVDRLYKLILKSTSGKTKFDASDLRKDLFEAPKIQLDNLISNDSIIEFDHDTISKSSKPIIQAFLAVLNNELVGYIFYRHFYSPWLGHCFMIDDAFVVDNQIDKKAIFDGLEEEVLRHAQEENLLFILYNVTFVDERMLDAAKTKWLKRKETDWSLIRIDFETYRVKEEVDNKLLA